MKPTAIAAAPPRLGHAGEVGDTWEFVGPVYVPPGSAGPLAADLTATAALAVPLRHSNPTAFARLELDFDGDFTDDWGGWWKFGDEHPGTTPAFDRDGNPAAFSAAEVSAIDEIFTRVAEYFSPFNIDVTTDTSRPLKNRESLRAVIGGDGAWLGEDAGGVGLVNEFNSGWDSDNNKVFVFSALGGSNGDIAKGVAHEAGHALGLEHQSSYSLASSGRWIKDEEYTDNQPPAAGTMAGSAPFMGEPSGNGVVPRWWSGASAEQSASSIPLHQFDLTAIARRDNGFGYRADDAGGEISPNAKRLEGGGSTALVVNRVIERMGDVDVFRFDVEGLFAKAVQFRLDPAMYGNEPIGMLHGKLQLLDGSGTLIAQAAGRDVVSATLNAGTYYLRVSGDGTYGDVGQYSIRGVNPNPGEGTGGHGVYSVAEGGQVTLRAGDLAVGGPAQYLWDVNGDGVNDLSGQTVTFDASTLQAPDARTVRLTVKASVAEPGGIVSTLEGRTNLRVDAYNVIPRLFIGGAPTVSEGSEYVLRLGATAAMNSWRVDWGDGNVENLPGSTQEARHVYPDNVGPVDRRQVSVTAADAVGVYGGAGAVDSTFGSSGTAFGLGRIHDSVVFDDGRVLAVGETETSITSQGLLMMLRSDGTPDSMFGTAGRVTIDLSPSGVDLFQSVDLQSDGKIIVGGTSFNVPVALRFLPDGQLDPTFGSGGVYRHASAANVSEVAVDAFDRIVLAGSTSESNTSAFAIRLQPNGQPDPLFANGNSWTSKFGLTRASVSSICLASDGSVLLGVQAYQSYSVLGTTRFASRWALAKLTPSGGFDPTYGGGDGWIVYDLNADGDIRTGTLQQLSDTALRNGNLVVAGTISLPAGSQYLAEGDGVIVMEFLPNGDVNYAFNGNARYNRIQTTGGSPRVGVQADGKIVAGSMSAPNSTFYLNIARLTGTGVLDTTFAADGRTSTAFAPSTTHLDLAAVAVRSDGRIVVTADTRVGTVFRGLVARFQGDSLRVRLTDVPPQVTIGGAATAEVSRDYVLSLGYEDIIGDSANNWTVDWGDGSVQQVSNNPGTLAHTYESTGTFTVTAIARNDDGAFASNAHVVQVDVPAQAAYRDLAYEPGETIEAEAFDQGGEGIAYHDLSVANTLEGFRPGDAVDVASPEDGVFYVDDTHAGEWLEYAIEAPANDASKANTPDVYRVQVQVASRLGGGRFHFEVDGMPVGGPLDVPATGTDATFVTLGVGNVSLTPGAHTLRLAFDQDGAGGGVVGVFDALSFTPVPVWLDPFSAAAWNPTRKTLTVTGAATIVANPAADAPSVNASGAAARLTIDAPTGVAHLTSLNLSNNAIAALPAGASKTLVVGSLSLTGGARLDLAGHAMIVRSGGLAAVQSLVASAFQNGSWQGPGVTSTTAAADPNGVTALGIASNLNLNRTVFAGVTGLTSSDVLVRYTYYGDANLDGQVDIGDLGLLAGAWQQPSGKSWFDGDFTYDGAIDIGDLGLLSGNWQKGTN